MFYIKLIVIGIRFLNKIVLSNELNFFSAIKGAINGVLFINYCLFVTSIVKNVHHLQKYKNKCSFI